MPQAQDDINGADAMKQAPTPGPLSEIPTALVADTMNVMARAYERIHSMPRISDTDLANRVCEAKERLRPFLSPTIGSELNPATADLVDRFAAELKSKLTKAEAKYGYAADWLKTDWQDELTESLAEHIQKGDPRDVAAYCAFAWHHGWSTSDVAFRLAPAAPVQASGSERVPGWPIGMTRGAIDDVVSGRGLPPLQDPDPRPQPSGETREQQVAAVMTALNSFHVLSGRVTSTQAEHVLASLDALSARPLALGGQHSGGEVPSKWVEVAQYAAERGLTVHESNIRLEEFRRVVTPAAILSVSRREEAK